jgi:L-ascorbate metabolism protein UlaG (beta-lactamase superfamily)
LPHPVNSLFRGALAWGSGIALPGCVALRYDEMRRLLLPPGVYIMTRLLTALAASLFVVSLAAGADSKKVILRWNGQSFFELESSQGTRIAIDPHAIDAYNPMARKKYKADLLLISHFHNDHTQRQVIENHEKVKVIEGLKPGKKVDEWNLIDEKFRDVRIRTVGVYHDSTQGMERGRCAVFVLEMDGIRIVHLSDLGHQLTPEQIKKIGPVDVLLIPVGGVYTINGSEAKEVVKQLKPRQYIVPMHYGTAVYDDLLSINEFLDEQKKENIKRYAVNKLTIETDFKPEEPVIAILNWK